jgi:hypothetical protein
MYVINIRDIGSVAKDMWLMHAEDFILLLWLINLKKDNNNQH